MSDLTYKKKSDLRLKSQSAALKSAANGVVITNTNGEIVWINPAFSKLTGYTWKEVVGKTPGILNSGKHDKSFFTNMWRTISDGNVWHGEIINKKKNGDDKKNKPHKSFRKTFHDTFQLLKNLLY
jgi:sigma-B regulation protein RsbU (phosphoserine phosphatase)